MSGAAPDDRGFDVGSAFRAAAAESRPDRKRTRAASPRVTLRLSVEENERLRSLAEGQPVSAYIRSCLFGGKTTRRKRRSHAPVQDQEAMAQALALLGRSRMANNLNQLVYHANIGTLPVDEETRAQIVEACTHIRTMRDALIAALGLIEGDARP